MSRPDRRVLRTRQMLIDALHALMGEKAYDAITIAEITARADLRRATFYLHYRDKDELLLDSLRTTFDALSAGQHAAAGDQLGGKTQVESYRAMFEHVAANAALYRTILTGQGAAVVSRYVRGYLAGLILDGLRDTADETLPLPREVLANFIAGAEVALVLWWLENDQPYPPDAMAEMARRLIVEGLPAALRPQ